MARFEWDPEKARSNLRKHGVAFEAAERFEFYSAFEQIDDRACYDEERIVAIGFIGDVLFTLTYTERDDRIQGYFFTQVINSRDQKICRSL